MSRHGLWLLLDDRELFLGFSDFPWFADATIHQLGRIERPAAHHLYWPELDVDLAVDSIEHPERYPLTSRVSGTVVREASPGNPGTRSKVAKKK
ncbi:MAG: DUF2442 domain-containing protein [Gemmatimonadota bacterium]|nr:DUF2442 domain-containing protein [Gemmatimonadota bacterium]